MDCQSQRCASFQVALNPDSIRGKAPYKIYSLLCLFAYLFVVPTFMVNAAVDNSGISGGGVPDFWQHRD